MAEGHTVVRWARRLRPMIGQPLELIQLPRRWADRDWLLVGQHLTAIETRGKHLLLHISDGQTAHCHALMFGSWQVGRPRMRLRKKERDVRLRLRTADREAVFFHGPVVELLTAEELAKHAVLKKLGPDILGPSFDREEAWQRLQKAPGRTIGDAVLDQNIVAGIGNVYKSEAFFVAGIDPQRPVGECSRREIERIWDAVIPLMQEGARDFGPITTLPPALREGRERNWVYRRNGRPCRRCTAAVQMVRQGVLKRTTYFCPACQR
jgi:DNA-formamidopyrimidine glycosylase